MVPILMVYRCILQVECIAVKQKYNRAIHYLYTRVFFTVCMVYSTDESKKATENFSATRLIGKGGFGEFYSAELRCSGVAAKVLKKVRSYIMHGSRDFLLYIEGAHLIFTGNGVLIPVSV